MVYKKKTNKEKKAEIQSLIDQMDKSVEKYFESQEDLLEYLTFMSKFYNYSPSNAALIQSQFRGAQAVGSYKFWKEQGYSVKKGEKGIKILVPQKVKGKFQDENGQWKYLEEATEKEKELIEQKKLKSYPGRTVFGIGHVFDVSQTTCPESDLPKVFPNKWLEGEVKNYKAFMDALNKVADSMGVKIVPPRHELGAAKGAFYPLDNVISLNPRNSELQNVTTLIHELAHAKLHTKEKLYETSTSEKEFQAEMVSYVVSAYFGLDTPEGVKEKKSLSYLSHWTKGKNLRDKTKLLREVRETSKEFIDMIEKHFTKEKNNEYTAENINQKKEEQKLADHGIRKRNEEDIAYLINMIDSPYDMSFLTVSLSEFRNKMRSRMNYPELDNKAFAKVFNEKYKERFFLLPKNELKEPMVLIRWSEHNLLPSNHLFKFKEANELFASLNKQKNEWGGYYKTRYAVLLPDQDKGLNLIIPDRYDIGDGFYKDIVDQLKKDRLITTPKLKKQIKNALEEKGNTTPSYEMSY